MEEEYQRKGNAKRAIILIGSLVMFTIVAFVIYFAIDAANHPNMITNERTGEFAVFTKSDYEHIQNAVRSYLKNAYKYSDDEILKVKITIREGSVVVEEWENEKNVHFIIDLDSPKLTYAGQLVAGGSEDDVFVTCPPIEKMQDKNVFCIGHDRESTIDMALGEYLPYDNLDEIEEDDDNNASGVAIQIWQDYDEETGIPTLKVSLGACKNSPDGNTARKWVMDWIRENGKIDPEILPLDIIYADCSGSYINVDDSNKPVD